MNFWERDNSDYGKKDNFKNSNQNNGGWGGNGANSGERTSGNGNRNGNLGANGYDGNGANPSCQSGNNSKEDFERFAADSFNKYSNMDETQLMSELLKTAGGMRQNGTLKSDDLENFYKTAAGLLTAEQMTKLRTLINMLKNI